MHLFGRSISDDHVMLVFRENPELELDLLELALIKQVVFDLSLELIRVYFML